MKRVFSLFSSSESKRPKTAPPSPERVMAHLDSVERVQAQLLDLDVACSNEQLAVQRRYDELRRPLLNQRKSDIALIPQFWFLAISHHPSTDRCVFDRIDSGPLSHLLEVDLEDNLDDFGSYRIALVFSPNQYFSEIFLERTVTFSADNAMSIVVTPIRWAPHQRPRTDPRSFFTWFINDQPEAEEIVDFGEIFRQDLWQNPFAYFCNLSVVKPSPPVSPSPDIEVREGAE